MLGMNFTIDTLMNLYSSYGENNILISDIKAPADVKARNYVKVDVRVDYSPHSFHLYL